ncbi:rod shape-determining protein RodA [Desulfovermiculus halophilus]|jgi:rod shape determining protein RodA|uniref:rod shape-determining protein RodA n=1 Tax=Desulfovermiculus halophilus TaxID=339722 RepID=UPI000488D122|nr:rod shape-determining protein RodA [Desulfovermiculus halophilus]
MSPFDRRLFTHLNWTLLLWSLALFGLGVMNLYSASSLRGEGGMTTYSFYQKQMLWGLFGMGGLIICSSFDYRHLRSLAWPLYWVSLGLLLTVLLTGESIYGASRWIDLGLFHFQPTELAKLSCLLLTALLLTRTPTLLAWSSLGRIMALILLPVGLIIVQPDLGSGLNILLLAGGMMFYHGIRPRVFWTLSLAAIALMPLGWFGLQDYQKERILTFLNPETDPLGAGYNILQSQIAIGSGQTWGKGFLEGTQSQLRFLPEKHTDFVFAVFGEEWGFAGTILLLILFCLFLYQIIMVIQDSKDRFGHYLAVGVFFYFFWQIAINMGMVLGLLPVVGIPLPFLSYGGTSTLINFCFLGLALNVSMRRFVFKTD